MIRLLLLFLILLSISVDAYEAENKLKVVIIAKVAKYISWQMQDSNNFVITILNNEDGDLFEKTYNHKKIKKMDVELKYIDNIEDLTQTHILYISPSNSVKLSQILEQTKKKNIFIVSDIRGFAQKGGTMQIYFASQKVKLRINLDVATRQNLKINSSLLRIADVIKEGS